MGSAWLRSRPVAAAIALAALGASAGVARAEVSAQVEGDESSARSTLTDETGRQSHSESTVWTQKYRLNVDEKLAPLVTFSAGGLLNWNIASSTLDGLRTDTDDKQWDGNAHLRFGNPILSGGVDYDRRQETITSRLGGVPSAPPGVGREAYGGSASWRPVDLPSLDLRLSRTNSFDSARQALDLTTDEAVVTSKFDPLPSVDLRYTADYTTTEDRIGGSRTTAVTNALLATWTDKFLEGRGNAYVSYSVGTRNAETSTVAGATGTVALQRSPVAGLSLVESPTDTPTRVTLNPNGRLIDGLTSSSDPANPASAGVNLGFSASSGAVVTFRDLGAQLPNDVTPVNAVYVWVDRQLPPAVSDTFTWAAYQSIDNVNWTPVGLAGPVVFDQLLFRFQIPIQPTQARYLKVVTKPLQRTLTTDPQFSDIFVTELQLYQLVSAALARGRSFAFSETANATAKVLLLRGPNLSYDFSALVTHATDPSVVTYAVVNGLGGSQRVSRTVTLNERVDRTDSDGGKGHESLNRVSAGLAYEPLPTLGGSLVYTGQLAQTLQGTIVTHAASLFGRADLYEGLSASATAGLSWARNEVDRATEGVQGSASLSVVPNRVVSVSGSGSYSYAVQTGGGLPDQPDRRGLLQGTASLSPFPALALSGSVIRTYINGITADLISFGGGFSPFAGGDLQLRYQYDETLDTSSDTRTRVHGPSLRWNIRPGWFFNAGYSFQTTREPAQTLSGQAFSASLLISLR